MSVLIDWTELKEIEKEELLDLIEKIRQELLFSEYAVDTLLYLFELLKIDA